MKKILSSVIAVIMIGLICIGVNAETPKINWDYEYYLEEIDYLGWIPDETGCKVSHETTGSFCLKYTAPMTGFYEIVTDNDYVYIYDVSGYIKDDKPYNRKDISLNKTYYFRENETEYLRFYNAFPISDVSISINYLGTVESFSIGDDNAVFIESFNDIGYALQNICITFSEGRTLTDSFYIYSNDEVKLEKDCEFSFTIPVENVKRTFTAKMVLANKYILGVELDGEYDVKIIQYYNASYQEGLFPQNVIITDTKGHSEIIKSGQTYELNGIDYCVTLYIDTQSQKICARIGDDIVYYLDDVQVEKTPMSENLKRCLQSRKSVRSIVENINVNTSFFAKLIAFFRGLFGNLPVWIDNVEQ